MKRDGIHAFVVLTPLQISIALNGFDEDNFSKRSGRLTNQYKKFSLEHIANFSLSGSLCAFVFAAVIKITFGQ